jgi:citrate lyase subunit beta/citryl-CoA lyase
MSLARSFLFAPGTREDLLRKALEGEADAVVLDLEDSVPAAEKAAARGRVSALLESRPRARPVVWVRVNAPDGSHWRADVEAVIRPGVRGIRVPKARSVDAVRAVADAVLAAEDAHGVPRGTTRLGLTIETADAVLAAPELARLPRVAHLVFGAADFAADVGAEPGEDERELLFARSQLVLAARAAGIHPPVAGACTRLDDLAGLERSSRQLARLGFFGRSCLHPRQVPVVNEVFTPSPGQVARAQEIVQAYAEAAREGAGGVTLADREFVDAAVVRRAESVLELARSLGAETKVVGR